jgi:hypothetical protein
LSPSTSLPLLLVTDAPGWRQEHALGKHGLRQGMPLRSPFFPVIYPRSDDAEREAILSGQAREQGARVREIGAAGWEGVRGRRSEQRDRVSRERARREEIVCQRGRVGFFGANRMAGVLRPLSVKFSVLRELAGGISRPRRGEAAGSF